jgi:hypothetical protein
MKTLLFTISTLLSVLLLSCNTPIEPIEKNVPGYLAKEDCKATGTVEVMRANNNGSGGQGGNGGGGNNGNQDDKIMIADFNAHEEQDGQPAHGVFLFSVLNSIDSSLHRQITIDIDWVYVEENTNKAWFKGVVITDTKGCAGNGSGGHDGGCEGGGCSGDENGDHTEGCSGHDSGHDSGCSGDDGETHEGGCEGSGGQGGQGGQGGNGGGGANGQNCRVGQILAVKVHDVGTPGTNGDGITWKWFDPDDGRVANQYLETGVNNWPHLCKKTILAGNLVVHY